MKVGDINKPVTAMALNESLARRFGTRIKLEDFTLEQLQDARNKIRTKLSQVETNESFDSVHKSDDYQKSKLFLDVLNAEISERSTVSESAKPDYIDLDNDGDTDEPMRKAAKDRKNRAVDERAVSRAQQQAAGAALAVKRGDRPRSSLQGASAEMIDMSTAELEKIAGTSHRGLPQRKTNEGSYGKKKKKKRRMSEGAEDRAELVMAAKDMVDRLTGWMEDTAEMQTESMLELADAIRDEHGQQQSQQFVDAVKPALEQLYQSMETTRVALTTGVQLLTGEAEPSQPMGAPAPDAEQEPLPPLDGATPAMEPTVDQDDQFGAAPPAAGGDEEAGRPRRESKINSKNKIIETSRTLGMILSKKK